MSFLKHLKSKTIVYHVENPDVPGTVIDYEEGKHPGFPNVPVRFSIPVGFRCNSERGSDFLWMCSEKLLHRSSSLAKNNNKSILGPLDWTFQKE